MLIFCIYEALFPRVLYDCGVYLQSLKQCKLPTIVLIQKVRRNFVSSLYFVSHTGHVFLSKRVHFYTVCIKAEHSEAIIVCTPQENSVFTTQSKHFTAEK